jgi:predicted  nucleic acid-binding Zn-ribbon protein
MKKMYTSNTEDSTVDANRTVILDDKKRIKNLEDTVRQLSEQVNKLASALAMNSRQIRRQNTDINNVTTAVRNR